MNESTVKLAGRTELQLAAVRQVFPELVVSFTVSTVTLRGTAAELTRTVGGYLARTSGRHHPRASLHGVLRALQAQIPPATPEELAQVGLEGTK